MSETTDKKSSTGKKVAVAGLVLPVLFGAGIAGWKLREWTSGSDNSSNGPDGAKPDITFDDHALRHIDPALLTWKQTAEIPVGMKGADSFARLPDGRIVIVGSKSLRIIGGGGGAPSIAPVEISLSKESLAVAAGSDRIYVAAHDHVALFDHNGTALGQWNSLGLSAVITSIAVRGVGSTANVWLADAGQRIIVHCDGDGKVLEKFAGKDDAKHSPGLVVPSPHLDVAFAAIAADSSSDPIIWVNNPGRHELEGFSRDGTLVRRWGQFGMTPERFAGCCNPTDFAILANGRFVTSDKGVPRVRVFSPDGKLQSVIGGVAVFGEQVGGLDISVDGQGRVWVLDRSRDVLRVFEETAQPAVSTTTSMQEVGS